MLRRPFRAYYSELDCLVTESDALLCLGYGFADTHLNEAWKPIETHAAGRVAIVDYCGHPGVIGDLMNKFEPERSTDSDRPLTIWYRLSSQTAVANNDLGMKSEVCGTKFEHKQVLGGTNSIILALIRGSIPDGVSG